MYITIVAFFQVKQENYSVDSGHINRNDNALMPPPPTPVTKEAVEPFNHFESAGKKKLATPLAAMLPSKYANVDVTELFPDFRHGKVI